MVQYKYTMYYYDNTYFPSIQFEETMDHLQEDINSLEADKSTLKIKLEQANKRAPRAHLTESILAEQASGPPGSVRVIVEDSPATLNKLESLQVCYIY